MKKVVGITSSKGGSRGRCGGADEAVIQWAEASLRKGFPGKRDSTCRDTEAQLKQQVVGLLCLPAL